MTLIIIVLIYLLALAYLGWKGYKETKTASDYLIAGRGTHPFVMALSYGATFISTSAIVGFGGAAGVFGLGLLWLTVLNIFVGIFIAFVFLGRRTRTMGHHLNAHTFPELLGKRYQSKSIQILSGGIVLTMIIYAAVVLIGAGRYVQQTFQMNYHIALFVLALIMLVYVMAGGLKGVMYTDALQGAIMFIGMVLLIVFTFGKIGGVKASHEKLADVYEQAKNANPVVLIQEIAGEKGLTLSEAQAGSLAGQFGKIMGELKPITDAETKKKKAAELLSAVSLENAPANFKEKVGPLFQKSSAFLAQKGALAGLAKQGHQGWNKMPVSGSPFWWLLVSTIIMGVGIGVLAQPQLAVRFMTVKSRRELNRAVLIGGVFILMMTGVAFVVGAFTNVWFFEQPETKGQIALTAAGFNKDLIIPIFFNRALPEWFNLVLMLSLLSAAMSTLSSQFHAMGTAISRDILEASGIIKEESGKKSMMAAKLGVGVMLIITVIVGYLMPEGYIAAGTALFFGLCAASFLPAYIGALYWKKATKKGAMASIITGFAVSLFWLLFVHQFTLANWGGKSLFSGSQWAMVDPLLVGLPISALVFILVSLKTQAPQKDHVELCFKEITVK